MIHSSLKQIADQQCGYFSAAQATKAGYYKRLQYYHVECGDWLKVDRALYRMKGYPETRESEFVRLSFVLTGRSPNRIVVVSHESALHYYGLSTHEPQKIHLTLSCPKKTATPEECLVHTEPLDSQDYIRANGFFITTPLRTLLDLKPDLLLCSQWHETISRAVANSLITPEEQKMLASDLLAYPHGIKAPFSFTSFPPKIGSGSDLSRPFALGTFREYAHAPKTSFTLVEMLVVIAIIAILASLLMPALASTMNLAKQTSCTNQQKQMGAGYMMFADDHLGYIPNTQAAFGRYGPSDAWAGAYGWVRQHLFIGGTNPQWVIQGYSRLWYRNYVPCDLFFCPSDNNYTRKTQWDTCITGEPSDITYCNVSGSSVGKGSYWQRGIKGKWYCGGTPDQQENESKLNRLDNNNYLLLCKNHIGNVDFSSYTSLFNFFVLRPDGHAGSELNLKSVYGW